MNSEVLMLEEAFGLWLHAVVTRRGLSGTAGLNCRKLRSKIETLQICTSTKNDVELYCNYGVNSKFLLPFDGQRGAFIQRGRVFF